MSEVRSPYVPLLQSLFAAVGWQGGDKSIVAAMPHDRVSLKVEDLKETLEHLAFRTFETRTCLEAMAEQDCPNLFVDDRGRIFGVLARSGPKIKIRWPGDVEAEWIDADATTGRMIKILLPQRDLIQPKPISFANVWNQRTLVIGLVLASLLTNLFAFATPLFVMVLYDRVMPVGSSSLLFAILTGLAIILISDLFIRLIRAKTIAFLGAKVEFYMGIKLFDKLMSLPLSLLQNSDVNQQLTRFKQFEGLRDAFTGSVLSSFLDLPFTLIFLIVIFQISGSVGVCVVILCLIFMVSYIGLSPVQKSTGRLSAAAKAEQQSLVMELTNHHRNIRRLGAEELWRQRLQKCTALSAKLARKSRQLSLFIQSFGQTLMMLAGATTIVYGTYAAMAGDMTMGALIASMALVWRVLAPIHALFIAAPQINGYVQSVAQSNRVLQIEGELTRTPAQAFLKTFQGQISGRGLVFRYNQAAEMALAGVNFSFDAGERVAIAGTNGSGKSTLLNLIDGLYAAQAGALTIDRVDYRQIAVEDLRASISYAPQIAQFFHGTIRQNLLLNNPVANNDRIWATIAAAGLEQDIRHMPDGIETRLTEEMRSRVSPSVLRAIMLARTFVKDAPVYLVDEPFNGLDQQKEDAFFRILDGLRGRSTVVLVTRRPSHFPMMDRVLYMDQGRVIIDDKSDIAAKKIHALDSLRQV